MAPRKSADKIAARERARTAMAQRQQARIERDRRIETYVATYFLADERATTARVEAATQVSALLEEGESRTAVAELLGISTSEIGKLLKLAQPDQTDSNPDTAATDDAPHNGACDGVPEQLQD